MSFYWDRTLLTLTNLGGACVTLRDLNSGHTLLTFRSDGLIPHPVPDPFPYVTATHAFALDE